MAACSNNRIRRDLSESIRVLLGKNAKVKLKCPVRLELKGDKTENKVLVFTTFRLYIIAARIPSKIDVQFHYLDIGAIESKKPNQLVITAMDKNYSFQSLEPDSGDVDMLILQLASSLREIFPGTPLHHLLHRIEVTPPDRLTNLQKACWPDPGPCGDFSKQYACMCEYLNLPYREEVSWDVDTIYLSHDTKELSLHDFDHLETRDLIPIVAALAHNTWFTKFRASAFKLGSEVIEQLFQVLKTSTALEELHLDNTGLKSDFVQKLAVSVTFNAQLPLHTVDLSHNLIEDKGANHLSKILLRISSGFHHLCLARCSLTSKGVNAMAQALLANKFSTGTLVYLNLADNSLRDEVSNFYKFLSQPNSLTHLDLSGTDCSYELLFGALLRGCCQNLSHVNLSRNVASLKKIKDITSSSFKQFFSSAMALKYINVASTKMPTEVLKNLLLGLACNEHASSVEVDLSGNLLGATGAHILDMCLPGISCLGSLDISDNGLEMELAGVLTAVGKNKSIKRVSIGKNFTSAKPKHIAHVMEVLVQVVQEEDCTLEYLSLADSRLRSDLHNFVNALGSNQCLLTIDISGNMIGDPGARLLAKALQINSKLRALIYDRNNVTAQGFHDLACAMKMNYIVRYMPFPLHDAILAMRTAPEKTEVSLRKIETLVHRNVSPQKWTNSQAMRLQQSFLLSATQQMVDRLVLQTQETTAAIRKVAGDTHKDDISTALSFVHDADNTKQLLSHLHRGILMQDDFENPIYCKLNTVTDEINIAVEKHLAERSVNMLACVEDLCPHVITAEGVRAELQRLCEQKQTWPREFVRRCILEVAGTDIQNKVNELHLSLAASISDKVVDESIQLLSRSNKVLAHLTQRLCNATPDVGRTKFRLESVGSGRGLAFMEAGAAALAESPHATPQLANKRKSVHTRRLRPQSVMDDELLLLLPKCEPRLEHLVKDRPKRAKTRAPTTRLEGPGVIGGSGSLSQENSITEGLDEFFSSEASSRLSEGGRLVNGLGSSDSTLKDSLSRASIDSFSPPQLSPDDGASVSDDRPGSTRRKFDTGSPSSGPPKPIGAKPTLGTDGDLLAEMKARHKSKAGSETDGHRLSSGGRDSPASPISPSSDPAAPVPKARLLGKPRPKSLVAGYATGSDAAHVSPEMMPITEERNNSNAVQSPTPRERKWSASSSLPTSQSTSAVSTTVSSSNGHHSTAAKSSSLPRNLSATDALSSSEPPLPSGKPPLPLPRPVSHHPTDYDDLPVLIETEL